MNTPRHKSSHLFLRITTLLLILLSGVQGLMAGSPLVRNFTRRDYNAGTQNWGVSQSAEGVMYFANSNGLLRYDSRRWNLVHLPNFTTVRAVVANPHSGRLYVSGTEEFGYYPLGSALQDSDYVSLTNTLAPADRHKLGEIWSIHVLDDKVFFRADHKVLCMQGDKTKVVEVAPKISAATVINGVFYIATENGRIASIRGNRAEWLEDFKPLQGNKICELLPYNSGIGVVTEFDGFYHLNNSSLTLVPLPMDSYLRNAQVFCAATNGRLIAFGTVNRGVVIYNPSKGDSMVMTRDNGLQNNTVLHAWFDDLDNLWLGLDNGIDYVMCNSPFSQLLGSSVPYGAGYASLWLNHVLYLGTNQGLYTFPYEFGVPLHATDEDVPGVKGQIWRISQIDNDLFVCGDAGLFVKTPVGFAKIPGVSGCMDIHKFGDQTDKLLVSSYEGFAILERRPMGSWIFSHLVEGYNEAAGTFEEDEEDNIWISHWIKGLYRLRLSDDLQRFSQAQLYDSRFGLTAPRNVSVNRIGGKPLFSTEQGFLSVTGTSLHPETRMDSLFRSRVPAHMYQSPSGDIWQVSPEQVAVARKKTGGGYSVDSLSYRSLRENLIPGFDNITFVDHDKLIFANQDGFYEVDASRPNPEREQTLIISIAEADSLILNPTPWREDLKIPSLKHGNTTVRFEFLVPEYRSEKAVEYSVKLEGVDSDFTPYSPKGDKEYGHLEEGEYTLHIRAVNNYSGQMVERAVRFKVLPPWWRTWWAYTLYLLIALACGCATFIIFRTSSRRAALRMEQSKEKEMEEIRENNRRQALEKDYEIARLKGEQLEQDVMHKSEELTSTTMNLVRKNQILQEISSRLEAIEGENAELTKIRRLIKENISHDDDWNSFTRHFDGVYRDYLRLLREAHPALTQGDLRICAYLKMGLNSKEMASLLNISPRSVEMSRYRLRRKLGLDRDTSLQGYLEDFGN